MDVVTNVAVLARFGHALSDETRTRILLELKTAPRYPSDLAETLAVTRQKLSQPSGVPARLRLGGGRPGRAPDQIRTRRRTYRSELSTTYSGVVLAVDPSYCPDSESEGCC